MGALAPGVCHFSPLALPLWEANSIRQTLLTSDARCTHWRASSVCETVLLRTVREYRYVYAAMPVPVNIVATPRLRHCLSLLVLFLLTAAPLLAARGPDPSLRIPLEPPGFHPLSTHFLLACSSMLTLHYVDDQHLLLT